MATRAPRSDTGDRGHEDSGPVIGRPKVTAAGLPGVTASLGAALTQMGVRRSALTLLRVNQPDGFDCPGCAWPEPGAEQRGHLEFCENGAKAVAEEATLRRVTGQFFAAHPISFLAERTDHWLGQQGRLTEPVIRRVGHDHYQPISWDAAFARIADVLRGLASPNEAIFYTSGRTSNEAAFCWQLLARAYGTNNLPDCSNMCHESSGTALIETIGVGKGSVTLDDLHAAKLIVVVGQNPGTNHPRMLVALEKAKRAGATVVAVNPLPEAGLIRFKNPQTVRGVAGSGTPLADHFLQIKVGGDLALFAAVGALLVAWDAVDHAFIESYTEGFASYRESAGTPDWAATTAVTGLTHEQIETLARLFADSPATIVCWAMGLTQQRDSVATIREIVNVQLLRGMVGKPGAGLCPVRGHSNVQGDRTMGIVERPPPWSAALGRELGFEIPARPGYDTVNAIRAMRDGKARVFLALGGNFAAATPDTAVSEASLASCDLTVHVSTKLNRSHVVPGRESIILPCLGRTERDEQATGEQVVTVEDSMSSVHASHGRLDPASLSLRSEVAIVAGLGRALLGSVDDPRPDAPALPWPEFTDDYRAVRRVIAAVVPGFEDFETRIAGDGFTLPHPPRDARRFPTPSGRAVFTVNRSSGLVVPPGRLLLQTVRSHDQYNTTIYGLDDRYRGVRGGRRVVFVSPADLASLGIANGSLVDVVSEWADGVQRRATAFRVVSYPTAVGCAAAYFPEANVLVPLDSTADGSNTPTSKQIIVRLEPVDEGLPAELPDVGVPAEVADEDAPAGVSDGTAPAGPERG
jgi:molybdopterin-dependent oxidoreductase alpha subunit